jgi:hypothetical protein
MFLCIAEKFCTRRGTVISASDWYSLRDVCFNPMWEKITHRTILLHSLLIVNSQNTWLLVVMSTYLPEMIRGVSLTRQNTEKNVTRLCNTIYVLQAMELTGRNFATSSPQNRNYDFQNLDVSWKWCVYCKWKGDGEILPKATENWSTLHIISSYLHYVSASVGTVIRF